MTGEGGQWDVAIETRHGKRFSAQHECLEHALWYVDTLAANSNSEEYSRKGICIGSPYIHDLIVISLDGRIIKADGSHANADIRRYVTEMLADPAKLREVVQAKDVFSAAIPVFTYDGCEVVQTACEQLGYPNTTHDGQIMYDNTHSVDKQRVIGWAKENAASDIRWKARRSAEIKTELAEWEASLKQSQADMDMLNSKYP